MSKYRLELILPNEGIYFYHFRPLIIIDNWVNGGQIMLSKFKWCIFSECNLADTFFDSLKNDYEEFPIWFHKKAVENANAFVYETDDKIKAFVYLKEENEEIPLSSKKLPKENRL